MEGKHNIVADGFSRFHPVDMSNIELSLITEEDTLQTTIDIDIDIPKDKQKTIGKFHNSNVGHFGVDRTVSKLIRYGHSWKYMRMHVANFIKKCPCCQKMSYLKIPIQTHRFTTASYEIMQRISIDTVGEIPEDEYGFKYVIVIIDCFCRFIELFAVKDLSAISAAKCLLQWVGRYGCPSTILSDNGTQYANQIIDEFIYLMGSEHDLIMAYSKEENAIVERANKEVLRHLRAILFSKNVISNFSIYLPLVQRIFNADIKEALGVSPAQILFGNSINLDRGILIPQRTDAKNQTSLSEWMAKMLIAQTEILNRAVTNQSIRDADHRSNDSTDITIYPVL